MDPEKITYWYFRLNGCFTIENFILHRDHRVWTEADLLAVRFPNQRELDFSNDLNLCNVSTTHTQCFIVGVKFDKPVSINSSWCRNRREIFSYVLELLGVDGAKHELAIQELSQFRVWRCEPHLEIRRFEIGSDKSNSINLSAQLTWENVLGFIHKRFSENEVLKGCHSQWDETGKQLWRMATSTTDQARFIEQVFDEVRKHKV